MSSCCHVYVCKIYLISSDVSLKWHVSLWYVSPFRCFHQYKLRLCILYSVNRLLQKNACLYWLPCVLKLFPEYVASLLKELRDACHKAENRTTVFLGFLSVLKVGRSLALLQVEDLVSDRMLHLEQSLLLLEYIECDACFQLWQTWSLFLREFFIFAIYVLIYECSTFLLLPGKISTLLPQGFIDLISCVHGFFSSPILLTNELTSLLGS